LSAACDAGEVIVRVKDSGIGLTAGDLPRIFEMFGQVESALEHSQGGLGIGLSLVNVLVEMHGGVVTAHSDGLGKGSEFVVRLPVAPDAPVVDATLDEHVNDLGESTARRILVVDDNRDGGDSLAMVLRLRGSEVATAYDGVEAVQLADAFHPDVILLDIGLPGMNGYDACRAIRSEAWGKDIFMVAVTGWGQDEDRRKSRDAGFDHHFVKPVDLVVLTNLLASRQRPPR
jgi:CheY-like chemotaxis protein